MPEQLLISREQAESLFILGGHLPALKDVRRMLRCNPYVSCREKVLNAFIIGSTAKQKNKEGSDLDIAVIIPRKARKTALKFTEHYHAKFLENKHKPHWKGIQVDMQFFYEDDPELKTYTRIQI